jgi:hypothetical protein
VFTQPLGSNLGSTSICARSGEKKRVNAKTVSKHLRMNRLFYSNVCLFAKFCSLIAKSGLLCGDTVLGDSDNVPILAGHKDGLHWSADSTEQRKNSGR